MSPRKPVQVTAPDGGWGWVIVACSFLIHMFVVGTMYSLSVVYVVWLEYFGDGKGFTSWIISIAVALMFGIGPVPGTLSRKFGDRGVVIFGGILMSSGLFLSYFAVSIYYLVVTVGILTGTGAGCCYLPSVSMVATYFTTKRSLAMGVAAAGLGAGTFCMVPLLNWLLDYYGWRGCMLILSGISLNMCVLGALMQPPEKAPNCQEFCWHDSRSFTSDCVSPYLEEEQNSKEFAMSETCFGTWRNCFYFSQKNGPRDRTEDSSRIYHQLAQSEVVLPSAPVVMVSDHGCLNKPAEKVYEALPESPYHIGDQCPETLTIQNNCAKNSSSQDVQTGRGKDFYSIGYYNLVSTSGFKNFQAKSLSLERRCGKRVSGSMEILSRVKTPLGKKCFSSQIEVSSGGQLSPKLSSENRHKLASLSNVQIMLTGSIGSLVFLEQSLAGKSNASLHSGGAIAGACTGSGILASDAELHTEAAVPCLTDDLEKPPATKLKASVDIYVRLIQDGTFVVFGVSNFMTNISFFMPVLYMVDRALNSGIEKGDAALLISLYGAGNILGKLFFGWLADRKLVNRMFCYIACLSVCGVATCVSTLCGSSRELHSIYAFVFGYFIGAYVTLVPLVTIDLVGLPVVTESFSLLLCVMGVATAFGSPLAGWIFDLTGSYAISFVLHGVFLLISAFMLIPLMIIKRKQASTTASL